MYGDSFFLLFQPANARTALTVGMPSHRGQHYSQGWKCFHFPGNERSCLPTSLGPICIHIESNNDDDQIDDDDDIGK
jgi:hypothetical protein